MPEHVTAAERLARILYLIPAAAREGGARTADLAAALGVSEAEVIADLTEVTNREFYLPPGAGDEIQIRIGSDRIHIWTKGKFKRPVRLSPRETLALGLGLRALAAEAEPARRVELLALAARLEAELAAPRELMNMVPAFDSPLSPAPEVPRADEGPPPPAVPSASERFATVLARDDEDILTVVIQAARESRVCRIRYLKAGAVRPEDREIHPYHLVHAEGRWYLLAHAVDRDAVRVFRLDRILEAELRAEHFEAPADFDPARYIAEGGKLFLAEDDVEVAVRYSPSVARWVEERVACERGDDGSVVVRHRVADPRWAVRHVLQYGAEAEVLAPPEVRGMVGEAVRRLCAG